MAAIQGWDRAIGSLLGAFLRGRAESQQAETLRKILEQQQRQSRGLDDRMGVASGSIPLSPASDQVGTFGNAPFVSPADTPMLPNPQFPQESGNGGLLSTLGNALKTAGRYTLEGMTPGNAEADPIALQVQQSLEETKRKRSLADALELAKAKAQFRQPGFTERMYEEYARIHGPEAATKLWEQSQDRTGFTEQAIRALGPGGLEKYGEKLTGRPPIKPTRLEELQKLMTPEQFQQYVSGLGGGTPQIKDTITPTGQTSRQGVEPKTGKIVWEQTLPGRSLQGLERKKLSTLQDAYSQILELENLIVDPQTGKMKDVSGYTGWQGTEPVSTLRENYGLQPNELKFRNLVKNIANTFVRANEGAVVPDPMLQRLEKMVPALSNADASFPINLQQLKNRIQEAYANTLDTAAGAGFDVSQQRLPQNYEEVQQRIQERNQGGTAQKVPVISPQSAVIDPGQGAGTIEELDKMMGGLTPEQRQRLQQHMAPQATPSKAPPIKVRRDANGNIVAE